MELTTSKVKERNRKLKKANFIVAIVCIILEAYVLAFSLWKGITGNFWFDTGQLFTNQSNWLALIFLGCYLINLKHKFMKTNLFLILTTVYITITFFVYNTLILPLKSTNQITFAKVMGFIYSFFAHGICPALMITLMICSLFICDERKQFKWYQTSILGMIYPTLYFIMLGTQCYIKIDGEYHSVYGKFTNINPNFIIGGTPGSLVWLSLYFLVFALFALMMWLGWFFDSKLIKKYTKINKKVVKN